MLKYFEIVLFETCSFWRTFVPSFGAEKPPADVTLSDVHEEMST